MTPSTSAEQTKVGLTTLKKVLPDWVLPRGFQIEFAEDMRRFWGDVVLHNTEKREGKEKKEIGKGKQGERGSCVSELIRAVRQMCGKQFLDPYDPILRSGGIVDFFRDSVGMELAREPQVLYVISYRK